MTIGASINRQNLRAKWLAFYHSFPIQLLLLNFKKNQVLLAIWALLFGFITQSAGRVFGAPYLFLDPEYLNATNTKGFFIIGLSIGILITAFHITIYILDSYKFNFLAAIKSPFANFCFNNSIIPVLFVTVYCINIFFFQYKNGFQHKGDILLEIGAMLAGMILIMLLLFVYFTFTNKDIFLLVANNVEGQIRKNKMHRVNVLKKYNQYKKNKLRVDNYIALPFQIKKTERSNNIDRLMAIRIFDQNHLNAVIVEFFLVALIIMLGLFRDNPLFQIPAAASGILLFAMIVMFTGAFNYWLRGWSMTILIIAFFCLNILSKYNVIDTDYQVYGINYQTSHKAPYSLQELNNLTKPSDVIRDKQKMEGILNNWKAKFPKESKPKMVFICVSGGGQRAALWTLNTLQYVDNELNGDLMKHAILITGASGGMIGASYYRELYLQKLQGKIDDVYSTQYLTNISKDMLNPVIFSLVVNDLFFRFQKFTDGKYEYMKDRGYAFEQTLNRNTDFVFNKTIMDYKEPEEKSLIPMVILSPTIINDGRKLFISPQDLSFMSAATYNAEKDLKPKIKGVEFRKLFAEQDADNLHFLSALRMGATFPYVTPNVQLPSEPVMEIMDAGLSDNFGISDATRFLFEMHDWVEENTSGVIFVNIRDSEKEAPIEDNQSPSAWQKISSPISSLYNNWDYFQDMNNDNLLQYAQNWLKTDLDVIEFEYIPKSKYWHKMQERKINPDEILKMEQNERAALSWHLTTREKESLVRTILESNNQASLSELKRIVRQESDSLSTNP